MKIMIIGSMAFANEMLETQKQLQALGHEVGVPCDTEMHVEDPLLRDDLVRDKMHVMENDVMRRCFNLIVDCDAVLALNHRKNDIEGYLGASTLMEIGLAGHLRKKIFLLNPIAAKQRYWHETDVLGGVVIHGDLQAII
jgi:nucleoside 2-deoxyribosyltransferase